MKSRQLLLLCTCSALKTLLDLSCQAKTISGYIIMVPPIQRNWALRPHNLIITLLLHNPLINPT